VLRNAGTLYIDAGKPVPGLVDETVRNPSEVPPSIYFNVPAGYAALLPHFERDEAFATNFFARLRLIVPASGSSASLLNDPEGSATPPRDFHGLIEET
jgi:feruloyl-CoA synthase